ncbi:unnamed protein product [Chrysodeixis includens]|uniref:Uncharacterized protein n=1 Tax=Chrysodeixis includens TaxID=689277 RepID=A0A9N8KQR5_CHRIL|nr:unnamed protein product [Chrysodeixis includens]
MKFKGLSGMKVKKRCNSCSAGDQRFISASQAARAVRARGACGASAGRGRGGGDGAAAGHHTPIARGTCDAAPRIIASFIKFSGTKLREFLIENKLRRDSLI